MDLFAIRTNRKSHQFSSWGGLSPGSLIDFSPILEKFPPVCFPSNSFTAQSPIQNKTRLYSPHVYSTAIASATLVLDPTDLVGWASSVPPVGSRHHLPGLRALTPSQPPSSPSNSMWMFCGWHPLKNPAQSISKTCFWIAENPQWGTLTCLSGSASPFGLLGRVYLWSGYLGRSTGLSSSSETELAISSISMHLAAILAFCVWLDNRSLFSNPIITQFLQGLARLYP